MSQDPASWAAGSVHPFCKVQALTGTTYWCTGPDPCVHNMKSCDMSTDLEKQAQCMELLLAGCPLRWSATESTYNVPSLRAGARITNKRHHKQWPQSPTAVPEFSVGMSYTSIHLHLGISTCTINILKISCLQSPG